MWDPQNRVSAPPRLRTLDSTAGFCPVSIRLASARLGRKPFVGCRWASRAAAASALHEDVEWLHQQVWTHHDFRPGKPTYKHGCGVIGALLAERRDPLAEARIRHRVRDSVCEVHRGAMRSYGLGSDGAERPLMVGFEVRDARINGYLRRPLKAYFVPDAAGPEHS